MLRDADAGGRRAGPPESGGADRGLLISGVHPVLEALRASAGEVREIWLAREAAGRRLALLRAEAAAAGVRLAERPRDELSRLVGHERHQGVVARLAGPPPYADLEDLIRRVESARAAGTPALLVLLDGIVDPQNLGAIIRSAEAAGAHGVVIPKDRAAGLTPAVVRASAGAAHHLPVARVTNLVAAMGRLGEAGIWTVGAVVPGSGPAAGREVVPYDEADLSDDIALVIGSEDRGLRRLVIERCDRLVTIPMAGRVGALNASAAAAVLLFEARRQRRARQGR